MGKLPLPIAEKNLEATPSTDPEGTSALLPGDLRLFFDGQVQALAWELTPRAPSLCESLVENRKESLSTNWRGGRG